MADSSQKGWITGKIPVANVSLSTVIKQSIAIPICPISGGVCWCLSCGFNSVRIPRNHLFIKFPVEKCHRSYHCSAYIPCFFYTPTSYCWLHPMMSYVGFVPPVLVEYPPKISKHHLCWSTWHICHIYYTYVYIYTYGYGSIPISTTFNGMKIHLPAILMFTRGTRFWHTAISAKIGSSPKSPPHFLPFQDFASCRSAWRKSVLQLMAQERSVNGFFLAEKDANHGYINVYMYIYIYIYIHNIVNIHIDIYIQYIIYIHMYLKSTADYVCMRQLLYL